MRERQTERDVIHLLWKGEREKEREREREREREAEVVVPGKDWKFWGKDDWRELWQKGDVKNNLIHCPF